MNNINKKVFEFITKYNCLPLSYDKLVEILHSQGFSIITYSHFSNDPETEDLLNSLHILDFASKVKAFTYVDETMRLVFILEDLSDDEKLILLSHEEGHIFLGHLLNQRLILGQDIVQEDEANRFSLLLRNPNFAIKAKIFLASKKTKVVSICTISIAVLIMLVSVAISNSEECYYITKTGSKYHIQSCEYIKSHKTTKISKKEAERLGYTPCDLCIK